MAINKDQAIVIRRLDFSETSQVLAFLTRGYGQQRLLAKGVKRSTKTKFMPGIDLLEQGDLAFRPCLRNEGGLGILTEWRQTEAFLGLRRHLNRWFAAQYAAEIIATMTEPDDPHPDLFDALVKLLVGLSGGIPPVSQLIEFQTSLLHSAGLWPDLTRCVICDRPAPKGRSAYFSAHQGGLVCRNCQPKLPETRLVHASILTALRDNQSTDPAARKILDLLDYMISQVMGRPTLMVSAAQWGL